MEKRPLIFRILVLVLGLLTVVLAAATIYLASRVPDEPVFTMEDIELYEADLCGIDHSTGEALPIQTDRRKYDGPAAWRFRSVWEDDQHHRIKMRWIAAGPVEMVVSSEGYEGTPVVLGSNLYTQVTVSLRKKEPTTEPEN